MRTAYDLSPLYRSMIGIDRMVDLIDSAMQADGESGNYPPYDIEKAGDDEYRVTVAVAGFKPDELNVTSQPNLLIVQGRKGEEDGQRNYLHRGIATRAFERRFELADYVVVKGADYADGVLTIHLVREVPEALRPRRIEIGTGPKVERLEDRQSDRKAA